MTMATTTIRIDIATLPDHLDRSPPTWWPRSLKQR